MCEIECGQRRRVAVGVVGVVVVASPVERAMIARAHTIHVTSNTNEHRTNEQAQGARRVDAPCVYVWVLPAVDTPRAPRLRRTCVDDDVDEVHALGERVAQIDMVEGDDAALALGALERLAPLEGLLAAHLVLIEFGKIVNDDRNGQRNHQDTANTTYTSYDLPERRRRINVTVADGGHRDARPPEGLRYTDKLRIFFFLFGKIGQRGEDEHAHREEEHQQAELLVRVAQREAERLQAGGVARQLEDTQDTHDAEHLHHAAHVLELIGGVLIRLEQKQRDEVRQDGEQVDDVQPALEELPLVGRGAEAQDVLEREPRDAHHLHHRQLRVVHGRARLVQHLHARDRVERERDRRQDYEQDGYDGDHLRQQRHTTSSRHSKCPHVACSVIISARDGHATCTRVELPLGISNGDGSGHGRGY